MKNLRIFNFTATDLKDFEQKAILAKQAGATHVMLGQLPRAWWMWERDFSDPYPNWCMGHAQIFKMVCPDELKPYFDQSFIDECFQYVKERCDVLKKLGLEPGIRSNEPYWLPEEVFRDHPTWRGARCDHPRRATKPYYSPCVDNPEVLAMYRKAIAKLCAQTGLSYFAFTSNDCGGGLCWSNGTYPGPNGPEACRNRPMSERICGFMDAFTQGAKDAGIDAVVHFNANIGFKEEEIGVNEAWHSAKENQIFNGRDMTGQRPITMAGQMGGYVRGVPDLIAVARSLARVGVTPINQINLPNTDFGEAWLYAAKYLDNPPASMPAMLAAVRDVCVDLVGEQKADALADAFYLIHEGELHFSHDGLGLIMYGCIHQRWINRPFVLFPEELTDEERSYYRRFQFQALDEAHANDLVDMQNIECVRGFSAAFLLGETAKKAIASFDGAIAKLRDVAELGGDIAQKANLLIRRLQVYQCLMTTCAHAAKFQNLIERTDYEWTPPLDSRWPTRNDPRMEEFQNLTRAEVDNAYRLASLLDGGYAELILDVTDEAHEDIFHFGPNLVAQIRKKAEIMLDHQLDSNRVYERHNI